MIKSYVCINCGQIFEDSEIYDWLTTLCPDCEDTDKYQYYGPDEELREDN